MSKINASILLLLLIASAVYPASDAQQTAREKNKAIVDTTYRENLLKHKDHADILVLPGILADRTIKRITIQAEATGRGEHDTIEFFLIAEESAHDYESLAVALAKPSDVHKALVFIGMTPGRPVNYEKMCFWPKGERVIISLRSNDYKLLAEPVRIEKFILNRDTNKTMSENGLVFTGSLMVESCVQKGVLVYAADGSGPDSLASNYNEPQTVLDIPRNAPQSDVYGSQAVNPDYVLPAGNLLEIIIEPEYKDGKKRVTDLCLDINPGAKANPNEQKPEELALTVKNTDGQVLNDEKTLNSALKLFTSFVEKGHDPFVTIRFGENLALKSLQEISTLLASIESENGIRIEPPPNGQLYYKSFLPNEEFRDRKKRASQPWELHFSAQKGDIIASLVKIEQIWKKNEVYPDLKVTEFEIKSPKALQEKLKQEGPGMPVILVYSFSQIKYGEIMNFLRPMLTTYPTIHVFIEDGI